MRRMVCFHKSNSGEIARSRLKLVLAADQSGCNPGLVESVRDELIQVLSRYMEFDSRKVDICLTQMECAGTGERIPALSARIPIRRFPNTRNKGNDAV